MGRASLSRTKIASVIIPLIIIGIGVVGAVTSHNAKPHSYTNTNSASTCPIINGQFWTDEPLFGSNHQTTSVHYSGVEGKTALEILRSCTDIQTKHYSFGDLVTAINGTEGNGPKYWSFYINDKLSDVGAGAYTTHTGDMIEWKLQ